MKNLFIALVLCLYLPSFYGDRRDVKVIELKEYYVIGNSVRATATDGTEYIINGDWLIKDTNDKEVIK